MKRLFLIIMVSLSVAETKVETITCSGTLRMSQPVHSEVNKDINGLWSVTTVIRVSVEHNEWIRDIYPTCVDHIYVSGTAKSSNMGMARTLSVTEARANAVCIGHKHYEQYRVYEEYWHDDRYRAGREESWLKVMYNNITGGK